MTIKDSNLGKVFKIVHNDNDYWSGEPSYIGKTFKVLNENTSYNKHYKVYDVQVEGIKSTNAVGEITFGREHIEVKYTKTPLWKKLEGL